MIPGSGVDKGEKEDISSYRGYNDPLIRVPIHVEPFRGTHADHSCEVRFHAE
jgi:hypothetical protein